MFRPLNLGRVDDSANSLLFISCASFCSWLAGFGRLAVAVVLVVAIGLGVIAAGPELVLAQVGASEPTKLGFGAKLMQLIPMFVIVGGVFYLIVISPQNRRIKEQQTLLASLKKGDAVVTSAGIYGKIFALGDDHILVEIAPNVRVKCERRSIVRLDQAA